MKNSPYLCIINLRTMKHIIRLTLLLSILGIIYFISNKNEVKETAKEIVNIPDGIDSVKTIEVGEQVEVVEKPKTEKKVEPILVSGQMNTYSNGEIEYTVEIDSNEELVITKYAPEQRVESWFWLKRQCRFKTNSINVGWVDIEYTIKNNELIIVENGQKSKYKII